MWFKCVVVFYDEIGDSVVIGVGESLCNLVGGGGCFGILW